MKLLSVTEYANKHKISRQATLKRINTKKIKAFKVGSVYAIKN